jgi:hypothetical protein
MLKKIWEKVMNDFINDPEKCKSSSSRTIQSFVSMYELERKHKISQQIKKIYNSDESGNISDILSEDELQKIVEDKLLDITKDIITNDRVENFVVEEDMIKTLRNFITILIENCECQVFDICNFVMRKYKNKYRQKLQGKTDEEIDRIIREDYEYVKELILDFTTNTDNNPLKTNIEKLVDNNNTNTDIDSKKFELFGGADVFEIIKKVIQKVQELQQVRPVQPVHEVKQEVKQELELPTFDFSIENELEKLIPDELGSMKVFFITVISAYFNNLHPIIWGQVLKGMIDDIFIALPMTKDDFFSFVSKHLLLNSGPFILKLLQMMRPFLTDEVAEKYNLTKLTYPLMTEEQVESILQKCLVDKEMTEITYNISASVGHVCIAHNVKNINDKYVIKIIKPLAIAQSCWEYYLLVISGIYPKGSCERIYIENILKANAIEMNVGNEIYNLIEAHKYYPSNYKKEFGIDVEAYLDTIEYRDGIVRSDCWYALATTLAPGIPVSSLVENNKLLQDTKYRACLHRCLDILVSRFFYVLVTQGVYHGDLHAGNIFFSIKERKLTMIDFGAMGELDLFDGKEITKQLITIVILSIFYNYDTIFDILTNILNSKCNEDGDTTIDMESEEYSQFKDELKDIRIINTIKATDETSKFNQYKTYIQGDYRVSLEKINNDTLHSINQNNEVDEKNIDFSIYDYLEIEPNSKETIIENEIPINDTKEQLGGDNESITFNDVLQKIITFYALNGVNIAIKFSEFNEFQKAYGLLLGVLTKCQYNSYRMAMAINTGIVNWDNATKALSKPYTAWSVGSIYRKESKKYYRIEDCLLRKKQFMTDLNNQKKIFDELKKCIEEDKTYVEPKIEVKKENKDVINNNKNKSKNLLERIFC